MFWRFIIGYILKACKRDVFLLSYMYGDCVYFTVFREICRFSHIASYDNSYKLTSMRMVCLKKVFSAT